ncbi:MAG: alpha/beta hydrolase-fold protein [Meiothermus sp.]|nr:alpha/beta hydrolase-fold protein [Meiothermus sp.]
MDTTRLVKIEAFRSEFLDNSRDVFVYLPPSYEASSRRYPVLYMHDGRHAFFADEYGDSWEADRVVDSLASEGRMREIMVVAVSVVSSRRVAEYFHPHPGAEKALGVDCRGDLYERFLADELKPFIDSQFHTLPEPQHTALLGASAGGVISYAIGFNRPEVFGNLGVMSPYLVSTDLETLAETPMVQLHEHKAPLKVWLDTGSAEGLLILPRHVRDAAIRLKKAGFKQGEDFAFYLTPQAAHTQQDWSARLHMPLLFFFEKMAQPVRLELLGADEIALTETDVYLNAINHFDTGFALSDLEASYIVGNSEILEITPEGRLIPKALGTTTVTYQKHGLCATKTICVNPNLGPLATVRLEVTVPPETPTDTRIWAGVELPRLSAGKYGGTFRLPRGLEFAFKVSRGMGKNERSRGRYFKVEDGLELRLEVEEWE